MPVAQLYPALDAATEAALRASIERFGVLVAVVVDQHGQLLDGHHRSRIAGELGVECPTVVREVADEDEAREIARTLNEDRRMLTREQIRDVARALAPAHSRRAVAAALGVSRPTVDRALDGRPEVPGSSWNDVAPVVPPDRTTGLDGKSYPATRQPEPRGNGYEPKTERQQQIAGAAARKLSNALAAIDGYCAGIANLDVPRAVAGGTDTDLATWERIASESGRVLNQFRRALKEATK